MDFTDWGLWLKTGANIEFINLDKDEKFLLTGVFHLAKNFD